LRTRGIFVVAHAKIQWDQVGEDGEMFGMSSARDRRPVNSGNVGKKRRCFSLLHYLEVNING
jgi:hypothetical protein